MPRKTYNKSKKRHILVWLFWLVIGLTLSWLVIYATLRQFSTSARSNNFTGIRTNNHTRYTLSNATQHHQMCPIPTNPYINSSTAKIIPQVTSIKTQSKNKYRVEKAQQQERNSEPSQEYNNVIPVQQKNYLIEVIDQPVINEHGEADLNLIINHRHTTVKLLNPQILMSQEFAVFLTGNFTKLAALLKNNPLDIFIIQDHKVYTFLEYAAKENITDIVLSILRAGYFENLGYSQGIYVKTLEYALNNNNWNIVESLLLKIALFRNFKYPQNVLFYSCRLGKLDILEKVINKKYFSLNNITDHSYALIGALNGGNPEVINFIYHYNSKITNYRDSNNQNILHIFMKMFQEFTQDNIKNSILRAIEYISVNDPQLIYMTDKDGLNALDYANNNKLDGIARILNEVISKESYYTTLIRFFNNNSYLMSLITIGLSVAGVIFAASRFIFALKLQQANNVKEALIMLNHFTSDVLTSGWQHDRRNTFHLDLIYRPGADLAKLFTKHEVITKQLTVNHQQLTEILLSYLRLALNETDATITHSNNRITLFYNFAKPVKFNSNNHKRFHLELYAQSAQYKTLLLSKLNSIIEKLTTSRWQYNEYNQLILRPEFMKPDQLARAIPKHSFETLTVSNITLIEILFQSLNSQLKDKITISLLNNQIIITLTNATVLNNKDFKGIDTHLYQLVISHTVEQKEKLAVEKRKQLLTELHTIHDKLISYTTHLTLMCEDRDELITDNIKKKFNRPDIEQLNHPTVVDAIKKNMRQIFDLEELLIKKKQLALQELTKLNDLSTRMNMTTVKSSEQTILDCIQEQELYHLTLKQHQQIIELTKLALKSTVRFFDEPLRRLIQKHPPHRSAQKSNKNNHSNEPLSPITATTSTSTESMPVTAQHDAVVESESTTTTKNQSQNNTPELKSRELIPPPPDVAIEPPFSPAASKLVSNNIEAAAQASQPLQTMPAPHLNFFTTIPPGSLSTESFFSPPSRPGSPPALRLSNSNKSTISGQPTVNDNRVVTTNMDFINATASDCLNQIEIGVRGIISIMNNESNQHGILRIPENLSKLEVLVKSICLMTYLLTMTDEKFANYKYYNILRLGIDRVYHPISGLGNNKILDYCVALKEAFNPTSTNKISPTS